MLSITQDGLLVNFTAPRSLDGMHGHLGLEVAMGHDNLVTGFVIAQPTRHDLSVSWFEQYSVFKDGKGWEASPESTEAFDRLIRV